MYCAVQTAFTVASTAVGSGMSAITSAAQRAESMS